MAGPSAGAQSSWTDGTDMNDTQESSSPSKVRDFVVDWLRKELVGPAPGYPMVQLNGEEILRPQDPPRYRYGCGILFPQGVRYSGGEPIELEEVEGVQSATDVDADTGPEGPDDDQDRGGDSAMEGTTVEAEPEVNVTDQFLPQTMGVSFLSKIGDGIQVAVGWGTYRKEAIKWQDLWQSENPKIKAPENDPGYWFRDQSEKREIYSSSDLLSRKRQPRRVLTSAESAGILELDVVSRPWKGNGERLITITLVNATPSKKPLNEKCFFQCSFEIVPLEGSRFSPYPERSGNDDEDTASLALLYRHRPTYAVGHGCATNWTSNDDGDVLSVRTEVLPIHKQTPIVAREDIPGVDLKMKTLATAKRDEIASMCESMASAYEKWIEEQERELARDPTLTVKMSETGKLHIARCRDCLSRIRGGIALLVSDQFVLDAFRMMNQAMLEQWAHYELASNSEKRRKWLFDRDTPRPSARYVQPEYGETKWRPFQLAFVLMNLRPMRESESSERGIVDVIWFPTGGGKTEAYLGLTAFSILLRRSLHPANAGTTVLMRYTLRLLTTQQFQRAASLICALERMRRRTSNDLGIAPISIGLWVGGAVTPNRHDRAVEAYKRLCDGGRENPFILLSCPWCGIDMGPQEDKGRTRPFGYDEIKDAEGKRIRFRCEDPDCDFSTEAGLPIEVVDQGIYEKPPTLLIGTVDKFAMLPLTPEARRIFGIDTSYSRPELIIQDELHLISGPLGSMVGHYESVIDELATSRIPSKVVAPRIVASTATIARASEQVRAVYGRPSSLFPPQGLRAGESFFAREGDSAEGRAYVGVHAMALSSHVTAQVRTMAALLQGPALSENSSAAATDPYWTLMVYFNSLRELGRAATLVQADIKEYLNAVWERIGLTEDMGGGAAKARRRFVNRFTELTSRIQSNDIPEVLQQLFTPKPERDVVDLCYATNICASYPDFGEKLQCGIGGRSGERLELASRSRLWQA
jgi:hypothetical protein